MANEPTADDIRRTITEVKAGWKRVDEQLYEGLVALEKVERTYTGHGSRRGNTIANRARKATAAIRELRELLQVNHAS